MPDALDEGPDEQDADLLGDEQAGALLLIPCAVCRGRIWRESERCPHCGHWLTAEERASRATGSPWRGLTVAFVILLIVMFLFARWV